MQIIFIGSGGERFVVEAKPGQTLMRTAVDSNVPGIVAECGGSCSCGTCRVFVDEGWRAKLPAAEAAETSMLEAFQSSRSGSRLSCQIEITQQMHGLTVEIPESQY